MVNGKALTGTLRNSRTLRIMLPERGTGRAQRDWGEGAGTSQPHGKAEGSGVGFQSAVGG